MDLGLQGKTALVMSSSRGLGAGEGAHVLLTGRTEARLADVVQEIRNANGKADDILADLTQLSSVDLLASVVESTFGGADILIANTGGQPPGRTAEADLLALLGQLETMVVRVAEIAARLIPHMQAQGWGGSSPSALPT